MRIEGSEVTTLITGVVVLFSALAASSNLSINYMTIELPIVISLLGVAVSPFIPN